MILTLPAASIFIGQHFCLSHCPRSPIFVKFEHRPVSWSLPFPRYYHTPCVTAKLSQYVPTIPFSYACSLFILHTCAAGTTTQVFCTCANFVLHVCKPDRNSPTGSALSAHPVGVLFLCNSPVGFSLHTDRVFFPSVRSIPCLLYTSPSPRDRQKSRMPSSA